MTRFAQQTKEGLGGNCFSACLASIFNIPLKQVPNFFELPNGRTDEGWWVNVREWLGNRGYGIMTVSTHVDNLTKFDGLLIVSGMSNRNWAHATIWQNGRMIHDPHPSGAGLKTVDSIDLIYPLDPSTFKPINPQIETLGKKIYISGGMTGYPEFNHPAFHKAALALRMAGYNAVNPAEINTDLASEWHDCLKADIAHLVQCDGVALLDGWEHSKGAKLESYIAGRLNIEVKTLAEWIG